MAIIWTHLFSAADDGSILFGAQLGTMQADIASKFAGGITNADISALAAIAEAKVAFDIVAGHNHDGANSRTITNPGASNYRSGLDVIYSTASNLIVEAGKLNFDGNATVTKTANTAMDVTVAGNYLAGSGPAANQHVYAVVNQSGTIKLTAQNPNVSNAGVITDGILQYRDFVGVFYRYLGSVRTDAGNNILPFRRVKNFVMYDNNQSALAAGNAVVFTAVALTSFIPFTATTAFIGCFIAGGNGPSFFFRPTGSGATGTFFKNAPHNFSMTDSVGTNAAQSIDYKVSNAGDTLDINVLGYKEYLE